MSGFISLNNITAAICLNAIDTLEKGKCEILKNEGLSKINLSCESTMRRIVVFAFGVNFQKKNKIPFPGSNGTVNAAPVPLGQDCYR